MSSILAQGTKIFFVPGEQDFSSFQVENVHWKCMCVACEAQTHFQSSLLSLRKATTGNVSALRRLVCVLLTSIVLVLDTLIRK